MDNLTLDSARHLLLSATLPHLELHGYDIQADALRALIGEQTKEYHFREQTNFPNLPHPVACQCFKCRTKPAKTHSQPDAWRFPGA